MKLSPLTIIISLTCMLGFTTLSNGTTTWSAEGASGAHPAWTVFFEATREKTDREKENLFGPVQEVIKEIERPVSENEVLPTTPLDPHQRFRVQSTKYDRNGNAVEVNRYEEDSSLGRQAGTLRHTELFIFDKKGTLEEVVFRRTDGSATQRRLSVSMRVGGHEFKTQLFVISPGQKFSFTRDEEYDTTEYILYDSHGKPLEKAIWRHPSGKFETLHYFSPPWDKPANRSLFSLSSTMDASTIRENTEYESFDGEGLLERRVITEKNFTREVGQIEEVVETRSWRVAEKYDKERRLYHFNNKGRIVEKIETIVPVPSPDKRSIMYRPSMKRTTYDDHGNIIKESGESELLPGHLTQWTKQFNYRFDSHGNWIMQTCASADFTPDTGIREFYDDCLDKITFRKISYY